MWGGRRQHSTTALSVWRADGALCATLEARAPVVAALAVPDGAGGHDLVAVTSGNTLVAFAAPACAAADAADAAPPSELAQWRVAGVTGALSVQAVAHQRNDYSAEALGLNIACFPAVRRPPARPPAAPTSPRDSRRGGPTSSPRAPAGGRLGAHPLPPHRRLARSIFHYEHFAPPSGTAAAESIVVDMRAKSSTLLRGAARPRARRRRRVGCVHGGRLARRRAARHRRDVGDAGPAALSCCSNGGRRGRSGGGGGGGGNGTALEVRALPSLRTGRARASARSVRWRASPGTIWGDASFRAANPAWQCKEDPYAAVCCYDSGVDRCASLGQFDGGGGVCVDRVVMTSADDGALAVPPTVRVLSLAAARQGVNEGAFAELPISSAAAAVDAADAAASSSSSSVVGGIVDEVAVDLDASNITGDASNATRRVSRLNTVKCDSRVEGSTGACDISNDLYTVLFVGLANSTVRAIGLQEFLCRSAGAASAVDGALRTSQLTQLYTQGVPSRLLPSPNAQHLFVVQTRPAYQLDSRAALHAACSNFTDDPTDPFVAPYAPLCDNASAIDSRPLNLFDFVSYHSVCRPGTECPSLLHPNTSSVVRGSFTLRPIQSPRVCPAGFFCVAGVRLPCLAGFVCPETNMSFPTRCAADAAAASTCYRQQLSEVQRCPDGMVCPVPQVQPFAAPPGRYVAPTPRLPLHECQGGQWCPLMAANESECTDADDDDACADDDPDDDAVVLKPNGLLCPANTYCPDPAMMRPSSASMGTSPTCSTAPRAPRTRCRARWGGTARCRTSRSRAASRTTARRARGSRSRARRGRTARRPRIDLVPRGQLLPDGSTQPKKCFFFLSYCPPGQAVRE